MNDTHFWDNIKVPGFEMVCFSSHAGNLIAKTILERGMIMKRRWGCEGSAHLNRLVLLLWEEIAYLSNGLQTEGGIQGLFLSLFP